MFDVIQMQDLFATPFIRFSVTDHAALDAELLQMGAIWRAQTEGVQKSNRGGWHSPGNMFDRDVACIARLRASVVAAVDHIVAKTAPDFDAKRHQLKLNAWVNMNPPGGFNAPHTHPGAHWSGVYYVSQPAVSDGSSGMIEFIDPRSDLPDWRMFKAAAFQPKLRIRPRAGEMIFFPSYLVHWVYPNETDQERVTIAFNATFNKKRAPKPVQTPD
jgi:uncharacterized protein (TIGR02466 family)